MTFEKYIEKMSLRDMVSHLLCPAVRATYREGSDTFEYYDGFFTDPTVKPGTIFFFPSKKEDMQQLAKRVYKNFGEDLLIVMDMETSPSCIAGCTEFGSAMAISAANSAEDAYICGRACAQEGAQCGVNWSFGPVCDLNLNPKNPITNIRSWGDDADHVIELTRAYIKGMRDFGMLAAPKHFPGDGVDQYDQHLLTTVNSLSREEWMNSYGKVWKALIDSGVRTIMPGHIALPAFEEDNAIIPATASYSLLTTLLRNTLGFDGLIVSDAISMGGIMGQYPLDDCYINMINAGCDVILFPNIMDDCSHIADVLEAAVNTGKISIERIKNAIFHIWQEKNTLGLFDKKPEFKEVSPEDKALFKEVAARIAKNSIVIHKNEENLLPLNKDKIKKVISVDITNAEGPVENLLDKQLIANGIQVEKFGEHTENGVVSTPLLPSADLIILNFYYGHVWGSNHIEPCGKQLQHIFRYILLSKRPVVAVCHGNPYITKLFPYMKTVVNTFSAKDLDGEALYNVLFGLEQAKGVSPVKL